MSTSAPDPSTGREAFLQAFRRHAAGVAAITSRAPDGRPVGFTATSLASLAAAPPLATFNMAMVSSAWPAMTVGNYVAIHMLGTRTRLHADRMAADHALRFDGEHWHAGPNDLPILEGVTAVMVGRIVSVHPVNENAVVVVEIEGGDQSEDDEALLYYRRRYHRPGNVV
ncbi:MAG: flavin reductase family protein [Rhodoglobus sp.]